MKFNKKHLLSIKDDLWRTRKLILGLAILISFIATIFNYTQPKEFLGQIIFPEAIDINWINQEKIKEASLLEDQQVIKLINLNGPMMIETRASHQRLLENQLENLNEQLSLNIREQKILQDKKISEFLTRETSDLRIKLTKIFEKLKNFDPKEMVFEVDEESKGIYNQILDDYYFEFKSELISVELNVEDLKRTSQSITPLPEFQVVSTRSLDDDFLYQGMLFNFTNLEFEQILLSKTKEENHPALISKIQTIKDLKRNINQYLKSKFDRPLSIIGFFLPTLLYLILTLSLIVAFHHLNNFLPF